MRQGVLYIIGQLVLVVKSEILAKLYLLISTIIDLEEK